MMLCACCSSTTRLVYWSSEDDRSFEKSLRHAGLTVAVSHMRAHTNSGAKHTLYVGQVDSPATRRPARTRPG